jgi:general secretion pathway protein G
MKARYCLARGTSTKAARAFTIVEVIVIVVILGIIAAVIAPRLLSRVSESKRAVAASNASSLATAMKTFIVDCGMPEPGASITILSERPGNVEEKSWKGPYVDNPDQLKDPWGNLFVLVVPGQKNVDFDIVSYGKDGQPGGADEAEDVVKP